MNLHPDNIRDLLRLGGRIRISGAYHPDILKDFARLAKLHNGHVTIKIESLHVDILKDIVRLAPLNSTLDLI